MKKDSFWEDLRSGQFASMVREASRGQILSNSRDVHNIIKPLTAGHEDVETMYGIFLNSKNRLMGIEKLFSGSINGASVYPREIVKRMLDLKANALILAHNHPSGNLSPSPQDKHLTRTLHIICSFMHIRLLDHFIIGDGETTYSFADNGLMSTIRDDCQALVEAIL